MKDKFRKVVKAMLLENISEMRGKNRLSQDSVDDQIDGYLAMFEGRTLKEEPPERSEKSIGESVNFSLKTLLLEEKPEHPDEKKDKKTDKEMLKVPPPHEKKDKTNNFKPRQPNIDIADFSGQVARLIENYESLLDVQSAIINRAKQFLVENYDESKASEFEETLESQFGIALDPPDNMPPRPAAAGAGPTG